jgi:hypothetical protein
LFLLGGAERGFEMLIGSDADVAFKDGVVECADCRRHVSKCVSDDWNSAGFETVDE